MTITVDMYGIQLYRKEADRLHPFYFLHGNGVGLFMISIGRITPHHINSIRFKDNRVKDHSVRKPFCAKSRLHRCSWFGGRTSWFSSSVRCFRSHLPTWTRDAPFGFLALSHGRHPWHLRESQLDRLSTFHLR